MATFDLTVSETDLLMAIFERVTSPGPFKTNILREEAIRLQEKVTKQTGFVVDSKPVPDGKERAEVADCVHTWSVLGRCVLCGSSRP